MTDTDGSDYHVLHADDGKVTVACGFGWSGPPTDEETAELPDLSRVSVAEPSSAAPAAPVAAINPHHPRFVASGPKASVTSAVVATPAVDERDYGSDSDDGEYKASIGDSVSMEPVAPPEAVPAVKRRALEAYESLQSQMARMKSLRESDPQYADAIMLQGSRLVELAETGNVIRIMEIVHGSEQGELLYWHTSRMFLTACRNGHVDVVCAAAAATAVLWFTWSHLFLCVIAGEVYAVGGF